MIRQRQSSSSRPLLRDLKTLVMALFVWCALQALLSSAGMAQVGTEPPVGTQPTSPTGVATDERGLPIEVAPFVSRELSPSLEGIQRGGRLFRLNCAPCHGVTAEGGALVFVPKNPPALTDIPVLAVPCAVRRGPGPMPSFPVEVLSEKDEIAIAEYVGFLHSKPHPGGLSLGFLGPVTEGFAATVGLLFLVLCAIWIELGKRG